MIVSSLENKRKIRWHYNHSRWESQRRFLRFLIRVIGFNFLAKLGRVEGLANVPFEGPAILMINHIAFIDPIAVLHVVPRNITPLAKIEVYNYPIIGIFPRIWGVVPVHREEFDRRAIQHALEILRAGEIILIAPEATRGPTLQRGKEGVAYLASRAEVPVIPVAIENTPGFPSLRFSKRWRGPGIDIRFGKPIRFKEELRKASREELRKMTDEAMFALASYLPENRRGVYADLAQATTDTFITL